MIYLLSRAQSQILDSKGLKNSITEGVRIERIDLKGILMAGLTKLMTYLDLEHKGVKVKEVSHTRDC